MAYQTGTFSTLEQLVTALKLFAEANGWTTDYFGNFRTAGSKWWAAHNADGVYLHWITANNEQVFAQDSDTDASYADPYVTSVVLYAGTGYNATKHPQWQPGVLAVPGGSSSTLYGYYIRHALYLGNVSTSGTYHLVAAPGGSMLFLFVDNGEAFLRHLGIAKTQLFSGGIAKYLCSGSSGPCPVPTNWNDVTPWSASVQYGDTQFDMASTSIVFAGSSWTAEFGQNKTYSTLACSPYASSTAATGMDMRAGIVSQSGRSGVTGVRPCYPYIVFRNVSSVLRFDGIVQNASFMNGLDMAKAELFSTTSGQWRSFPVSTSPEYGTLALRVDL